MSPSHTTTDSIPNAIAVRAQKDLLLGVLWLSNGLGGALYEFPARGLLTLPEVPAHRLNVVVELFRVFVPVLANFLNYRVLSHGDYSISTISSSGVQIVGGSIWNDRHTWSIRFLSAAFAM